MSLVLQPNGDYIASEPVWVDLGGKVCDGADTKKRYRLLAEKGAIVSAQDALDLGLVKKPKKAKPKPKAEDA